MLNQLPQNKVNEIKNIGEFYHQISIKFGQEPLEINMICPWHKCDIVIVQVITPLLIVNGNFQNLKMEYFQKKFILMKLIQT